MSENRDILLGIDFGTGGCKVTAISMPGASVVAEASLEYPTFFPRPGWAEQNPSDWYGAMCASISKISEKGVDLKRVRAVAFDGSTHNAVLLDENYKPVRNTIMWTDQRSVSQCKYLRENYAQKIFETAYQMPTPTWTLPQLMWLKENEPGLLGRVRRVLFVKDYARFLVTGEACTDYIEAQGTLFFDAAAGKWSDFLVGLSGLDISALPKIVKPCDVVGGVTKKAAEETGLPEGIPVVCGSSDSAVEDYGAGAVEEGDCIIKLATAGNVNVMMGSPRKSETTLTYSHIVDGMWYSVAATNAAALCLRWFRDAFCGAEKSEAEARGRRVFSIIDDLARNSDIGAGGVVFMPYLQGERSPYWDPNLRASFTGVSISSTKGDFIRALMEGVAFSLRDCRGAIEKMGLDVKRIFLIGGGARSDIWSEIICNVFNRPASVPIPGDASYGSALLAGVGAGFFASPKDALKHLKMARTLEPDQEKAQLYAGLFKKYKATHDALAPVYNNNF